MEDSGTVELEAAGLPGRAQSAAGGFADVDGFFLGNQSVLYDSRLAAVKPGLFWRCRFQQSCSLLTRDRRKKEAERNCFSDEGARKWLSVCIFLSFLKDGPLPEGAGLC